MPTDKPSTVLTPARTGPRVRKFVPSLRYSLDRLRERTLMIGRARGVILGMLAVMGVVVLCSWVDLVLDLPAGLRALVWIVGPATGLAVLLWAVRRTNRQADEMQLARHADSVTSSAGQIRAGWDLQQRASPLRRKAEGELSQGLAELAVRHAAQLASVIEPDRAISARPLHQSLGWLAGCTLLVALLVISMPRLAWTEFLRLADPYGDHPPYSPYEFQVEPGAANVRYGSSLDLAVDVSGRPVDNLELVLIAPDEEGRRDVAGRKVLDELPMFADASGRWHASISNITTPFDYYLRVRRARSRVWPVRVETVPEINEVRAEIQPPLYTGRSMWRGRVPLQGIEGLPGTVVRLFATSNRPLSQGDVTVSLDSATSAVSLTLRPTENPQEVTGEFTITGAGRLELTVTDETYQRSADVYAVPIRLLTDHPPVVRLMQPRAVSFATPSVRLPVLVAAEDDYGLRNCQLFRSLNDSRSLPVDLELPSGIHRRAQVESLLPLDEYGLQPGDEIKLFARVEDNDPAAPGAPHGKGAESAVVTVRIISQEEFERIHRQRAGMNALLSKYQQAERRLAALAEQTEKLQKDLSSDAPDAPLNEERRAELQKLAEEMQKAAEDVRRLSESPLPFAVDDKLSPKLAEMAEMLQQLSDENREASANPDASTAPTREQLQKQLERLQQSRQQHEQESLETLRLLQQILPLKQDENQFMILAQRQRQLADRLNSLRKIEADEDPALRARLRELEEEQQRVREALRDLMQRIEEDIGRLPEDERLDQLRETARELLQALRQSGASDRMLDAESALSQLDGPRAHEAADRAATALESLIGRCQSMGEGCQNCLPKFSPSLGQSLQETLNQLAGTGMGMSGMGQGGEGGYSSQSQTMDNVGMYGGLPWMDAVGSQMGKSDSTGGADRFLGSPFDDDDGPSKGFETRQSNPAFGGSEWGVPVQYRRQAGRYLQKLADELDDK